MKRLRIVFLHRVSKQFALKTGEYLSACLSRMRIERAKKLLLAAAVGCGNNPPFFSQIFKHAMGMTPSEYIHSRRTG